MTERASNEEEQCSGEAEAEAASPARRPYEPPTCEKKRSIHRVTLLSGMGVMSMGVLSMTN